MRFIALFAALLLASNAQAAAVWYQEAVFETPAATANDLAPLDFTLSFNFPGSPNIFYFTLNDLTPVDIGQINIDETNAAGYGLNWENLTGDVANYWGVVGDPFTATTMISTPVGSFSPICCGSEWYPQPSIPLTRLGIIIGHFGAASLNDPTIYFSTETSLYADPVSVPEPSSAVFLLGFVPLGYRRLPA